MDKSVLSRSLTWLLALITALILGLGVIFFWLYNRDYNEQRYTFMQAIVIKSANELESKLEENGFFGIHSAINEIEKSIVQENSVVYVVNREGTILGSTYSEMMNGVTTLPSSIMDKVVSTTYYNENQDLLGEYNTNYLTYGLMLDYKMNDEEDIYVFCTYETHEQFFESIFELMSFYMLAAAAVIFISVFLVYGLLLKLFEPLQEMSKAAIKYGSGDFSSRIPVNSNDEIGVLAQSMNQMADSLKRIEDNRSKFVANISHEIRTPITTIIGFTEGIQDGTIPEDRQPFYIDKIVSESKRLSRLVTSMLNLSRIESGELELNRVTFDMNGIILQTVLQFEKAISQKNITIEGLSDKRMYISADRDMIMQVIYNLVENAIKFVDENGTISFLVQSQITSMVVNITNTGNNLQVDEVPRLFDRFYKADQSRGMDSTGVGLGLNLVKTIISIHGGDISVDVSTTGLYKVYFHLPKRT